MNLAESLGLSLAETLSIASFSLAMGFLVARFRAKEEKAREHLALASIFFLSIAGGVLIFQITMRASAIRDFSMRIVQVIGPHEKTIEQIQMELGGENQSFFLPALDNLVKNRKLDYRSEVLQLTTQRSITIRLWHVTGN